MLSIALEDASDRSIIKPSSRLNKINRAVYSSFKASNEFLFELLRKTLFGFEFYSL